MSNSSSEFKPARRTSARWWVGSLAFHSALIGWLVFFSPVRMVNPAAKPKVNIGSHQANQVLHEIEQRQLPSLEQNLRKLDDLRQKMAVLETQKLNDYASHARAMAKVGPEKAAELIKEIAQLQAKTLAALSQANTNCDLFVQTRANAFYSDLESAQKQAADTQNQVQQLQNKTEAMLSFGDGRYTDVIRTQVAANAAQSAAANALADAQKADWPSRQTTKRTARDGQIEHYSYWVRRYREIVGNADVNYQKAINEVVLATRVVAWAEASVTKTASALTNGTAVNATLAKTQFEIAKRMLDRAKRNLKSAQDSVENFPRDLASARKNLPDVQAKLTEYLAQPEPEPMPLSPEDQMLIKAETNAYALQLTAQLAQEAVGRALSEISSSGSNAVATNDALTVLNQLAPVEPAPSLASMKSMSVAQLYDAAKKTEVSLVESYRQLRATHLAMMQDLTLARGMKLTEVAKPQRPDLAAVLQTSIQSSDQAVAAREALQTAKAQVNSMVDQAGSMLADANNLESAAGVPITTLQEYNKQNDLEEEIAKLASADSGWARDETTAMQRGTPGKAGQPGQGGPGGQTGQEGGGGQPGLGSGGGQPGAGGGYSGMSGVVGPWGPAGPTGFGMPISDRPPDVSDLVLPGPGRRIAAEGTSSKWLSVDSWYIIGPFDNTDRRNIDTLFPPQQVVNLDATYPGKNDVPIKWEFQQSGTPDVQPLFKAYSKAMWNPALPMHENYMNAVQYVIYFAYTELWFEKDCDVWVAFGSDDYGKVWVEKQLVWESGKELKAWNVNESVRRIHFKRGLNRILYRVENGNNITEFSMVLSFVPGTVAIQ